MQAASPGKTGIEPVHHRAAQSALIRRLKLQQAKHKAAPVLVIAAIADDPDRMGLAQHFRKRGDIPEVIL